MRDNKDTKLLKAFGKKLKVLRKQKGLSQMKLSYAADIELSQIHRIENAKINPTLTTLSAIASGLEITVAELTTDI